MNPVASATLTKSAATGAVAAGIAAAAAIAAVATATAKTTGQTTTTVRRRVPGAGAAMIAAVRVHTVAAVMGGGALAQAGAAAPVTGEYPPGNPKGIMHGVVGLGTMLIPARAE